MGKKRVESIDIARGIGILLVIWGHLTIDGQMSRFAIFTFHMPLFFMLSGIFADRENDLAKGAAKLVRTLLVPYLCVVAFDFIPLSLTALKQHEFKLSSQLIFTLKCAVGLEKTYNQAVWFLFALFIIKAVFLLLGQIKNRVAKDRAVLALSLVSTAFILTRRFMNLSEKCLYLSALGCFVFYAAGYFLRSIILNVEDSVKKHKIHLVLAPIALAAVVLIAQIKEMFIVHTYRYTTRPLLMLIAAACGCYAIIVISALAANISKVDWLKKTLLFYGKNSIVILMIHYPIARKFYPFIFSKVGLGDYVNTLPAEIILFIITAALMIPAIYLFNKYLYFIIGKKEPTR